MPRGNIPDPTDALDGLEPEMAEWPLGVPYVKPSGAPDLPGSNANIDLPFGGR